MKLHENAALVTLFFAVITSLLKVSLFYFKYHNIWTNRLYILLFTALTVAVLYTGYLGGQLVYSHGAGVELALPVFNN